MRAKYPTDNNPPKKTTTISPQEKLNKQVLSAKRKAANEVEEVTSRFQVKESRKTPRAGQGNIYLAKHLREILGWKKGNLLTIKLNKTKDGIEVRRLNMTH